MQIKQKPSFRKIYKKLKANQLAEVNDAIKVIANNPQLGVEKVGDLSGVFVYKFSCVNQQFLLAYEFDETILTLLLIGVHENFYKKLK
jgi:mRNA-degrading endonuclease RelE of RelBE toxin-antitoxin system